MTHDVMLLKPLSTVRGTYDDAAVRIQTLKPMG